MKCRRYTYLIKFTFGKAYLLVIFIYIFSQDWHSDKPVGKLIYKSLYLSLVNRLKYLIC